MCATCFGLYLDYHQACQYKNLLEEDIKMCKAHARIYYTFLQNNFVLTYLRMA
jgi:hypothetical protein